MDRREFLRLTGIGVGTLVVPVLGHPVSLSGAITPIPTADRKALAAIALDAARSRGASYADVRIGRYLNQFIVTREDKVENLINTESYGVGVRVIANGTWGFAATNRGDPGWSRGRRGAGGGDRQGQRASSRPSRSCWRR